jgi:hypothetical protein
MVSTEEEGHDANFGQHGCGLTQTSLSKKLCQQYAGLFKDATKFSVTQVMPFLAAMGAAWMTEFMVQRNLQHFFKDGANTWQLMSELEMDQFKCNKEAVVGLKLLLNTQRRATDPSSNIGYHGTSFYNLWHLLHHGPPNTINNNIEGVWLYKASHCAGCLFYGGCMPMATNSPFLLKVVVGINITGKMTYSQAKGQHTVNMDIGGADPECIQDLFVLVVNSSFPAGDNGLEGYVSGWAIQDSNERHWCSEKERVVRHV